VPDPNTVRAELERILASRVFWHAEGLRRLLRYIVEETLAGRAEAIKEYSIGLAAFDRGASFERPTQSSACRPGASVRS
jgi:adenylate cyclase